MDGVGERLRARARALQLSDAEVARRLGLSQSRYAHYVNDTREPDLATFVRICRVLGTTPNEVLGATATTEEPASEQYLLRRRIAAAGEAMSLEALRTAVVVMNALCRRADEV